MVHNVVEFCIILLNVLEFQVGQLPIDEHWPHHCYNQSVSENVFLLETWEILCQNLSELYDCEMSVKEQKDKRFLWEGAMSDPETGMSSSVYNS